MDSETMKNEIKANVLEINPGCMVLVHVALPAKIQIGMSLCLPLMTNCLFARKAYSLTIFVT